MRKVFSVVILVCLCVAFGLNYVHAATFFIDPQHPKTFEVEQYYEVDTVREDNTAITEIEMTFYLDDNYPLHGMDLNILLSPQDLTSKNNAQDVNFEVYPDLWGGIGIPNGSLVIDFNKPPLELGIKETYSYNPVTQNESYVWTISKESLKARQRYTAYVSYSIPNFIWPADNILNATKEIKFTNKCWAMDSCPDSGQINRIIYLSTKFKILTLSPSYDRREYVTSNYEWIWFHGKDQVTMLLEDTTLTTIIYPLLWAFIGAVIGAIITDGRRYVWNWLLKKRQNTKLKHKKKKHKKSPGQ